MESTQELIEFAEQNSVKPFASHGLFPSLKELSENALLKQHGASMVGLIKEDEEAMAQAEVIEYPGKVRYPGIAMFKQSLKNKLVSPVVLAVVQGDLPKTNALIQQNRMLSSAKGDAIDFSRRTIRDVTPFQAALCAWDDEMCKMLIKNMDSEEVARQYDEIFPQGVEAHWATQTLFDFSGLVDLITQSSAVDVQTALYHNQFDSPLRQALNQFRVDFTNRSCEEKIFNPKHLIKALQIYETNYERWAWYQQNLFWNQIVGYVQRFLPANIAQDVAQGVHYRVDLYKKARRTFNFSIGDGAIFPLNFDSYSGLGFDCAVDTHGNACDRPSFIAFGVFKVYIEQKRHAGHNIELIAKRSWARHCGIQ